MALSSHSANRSDKNRQKKAKFMIFSLGDHRFAVALSQVKEVIGMTEITRLPNVPQYFKGLINLRGHIISVIDLTHKLDFFEKVKGDKPCIIISEVDGLTLGFIVDDVNEVVAFDEAIIERNIEVQSKVSREHIAGVAKIEGKGLLIILDLVKVLGTEEFRMIAEKVKESRGAA